MTTPVVSLEEHRKASLHVAVADQVGAAQSRLAINPEKCPRLPWDTLHELLGPLWPEQFWVIAASTGNGKSSVLMQITDAWAQEGRRVYVLPLEQPVAVMRTYWAATALGYYPRYALENDWKRLPQGAYKAIHEHLMWQQSEKGGRFLVAFSDEPFVGEKEILTAFEHAARFNASVVVIDHLHRLQIEGTNAHQALVRICQTLKECAKEFRIPVLCAAQLHRGDGDVLAPYLPPKPTAIQGGEVVRQECDVAIGLYRPLLPTFTAEDARAFRMGQAKIRPHLEPDTIGVHVLKHRVRGDLLGEIVKLGYRQGKVVCSATEDRRNFEKRHDL